MTVCYALEGMRDSQVWRRCHYDRNRLLLGVRGALRIAVGRLDMGGVGHDGVLEHGWHLWMPATLICILVSDTMSWISWNEHTNEVFDA